MSNKQVFSLLAGLLAGTAIKRVRKSGSRANIDGYLESQSTYRPDPSMGFNNRKWDSDFSKWANNIDWDLHWTRLYLNIIEFRLMILLELIENKSKEMTIRDYTPRTDTGLSTAFLFVAKILIDVRTMLIELISIYSISKSKAFNSGSDNVMKSVSKTLNMTVKSLQNLRGLSDKTYSNISNTSFNEELEKEMIEEINQMNINGLSTLISEMLEYVSPLKKGTIGGGQYTSVNTFRLLEILHDTMTCDFKVKPVDTLIKSLKSFSDKMITGGIAKNILDLGIPRSDVMLSFKDVFGFFEVEFDGEPGKRRTIIEQFNVAVEPNFVLLVDFFQVSLIECLANPKDASKKIKEKLEDTFTLGDRMCTNPPTRAPLVKATGKSHFKELQINPFEVMLNPRLGDLNTRNVKEVRESQIFIGDYEFNTTILADSIYFFNDTLNDLMDIMSEIAMAKAMGSTGRNSPPGSLLHSYFTILNDAERESFQRSMNAIRLFCGQNKFGISSTRKELRYHKEKIESLSEEDIERGLEQINQLLGTVDIALIERVSNFPGPSFVKELKTKSKTRKASEEAINRYFEKPLNGIVNLDSKEYSDKFKYMLSNLKQNGLADPKLYSVSSNVSNNTMIMLERPIKLHIKDTNKRPLIPNRDLSLSSAWITDNVLKSVYTEDSIENGVDFNNNPIGAVTASIIGNQSAVDPLNTYLSRKRITDIFYPVDSTKAVSGKVSAIGFRIKQRNHMNAQALIGKNQKVVSIDMDILISYDISVHQITNDERTKADVELSRKNRLWESKGTSVLPLNVKLDLFTAGQLVGGDDILTKIAMSLNNSGSETFPIFETNNIFGEDPISSSVTLRRMFQIYKSESNITSEEGRKIQLASFAASEYGPARKALDSLANRPGTLSKYFSINVGFYGNIFNQVISSLSKIQYGNSCYDDKSEYGESIAIAQSDRLKKIEEQKRKKALEQQAARLAAAQQQAVEQQAVEQQSLSEQQSISQQQSYDLESDPQWLAMLQQEKADNARLRAKRKADAQAQKQRQRLAKIAKDQADKRAREKAERQRLAEIQRKKAQVQAQAQRQRQRLRSGLLRGQSQTSKQQTAKSWTPLRNPKFLKPRNYKIDSRYIPVYECLKSSSQEINELLAPSQPWQIAFIKRSMEVASNLSMVNIPLPSEAGSLDHVEPWTFYRRIIEMNKFSEDIKRVSGEHLSNVDNSNCYIPEVPNCAITVDIPLDSQSMVIPWLVNREYAFGQELRVIENQKPVLKSIFAGVIGTTQYTDFIIQIPKISFTWGQDLFELENTCIPYRLIVNGENGHGVWEDSRLILDKDIMEEMGSIWVTIVDILNTLIEERINVGSDKDADVFIPSPQIDPDTLELKNKNKPIKRRKARKKGQIPDAKNNFDEDDLMDVRSDTIEIAVDDQGNPIGRKVTTMVYVPSNTTDASGNLVRNMPPIIRRRVIIRQQNLDTLLDQRERATYKSSNLAGKVLYRYQPAAVDQYGNPVKKPNGQLVRGKSFSYLDALTVQSSKIPLTEENFIWNNGAPRRYLQPFKQIEYPAHKMAEDGTISEFILPTIRITDVV